MVIWTLRGKSLNLIIGKTQYQNSYEKVQGNNNLELVHLEPMAQIDVLLAVNVNATFVETQMTLSRTHGNNIRLEENHTKAKTINKCPAAISFLNFKILPNQSRQFHCTTTTEGSKKPSRFQLKIMAHRNDPQTLLDDFKGTFDTSVKSVSEPPWTGIDSLDRDVCEGTISLLVTDNNSIVCSTDRGYRKEMSVRFDTREGVWLIFELYRVSLRLLGVCDVKEPEILEMVEIVEPMETDTKANVVNRDELDSVNPTYSGNENAHVDEPNDTNIKVDEPKIQKCRPELSLNISRQHNFESSNPLVLDASALQEGIQRIEKSVEDIRVKINTDNVCPTEMVSPDQPSPPSNPVKLNFKRNFVALLHDVKADDIIDYLFQYDIISKNLYDQILAEKVPLNANRILLRQLLNKTVDRSVFERILNDSSYKHLIPLFLSNETNTQKHA